MDNNRGNYRDNIKTGIKVAVVLKENYKTGNLTEGIVKEILTNSSYHPHGIKVKLTDGKVGRVVKILGQVKEGEKNNKSDLGQGSDTTQSSKTSINSTNNSDRQPRQEPPEPDLLEGKLNPYRNPAQTTIRIKENETGYSYKNLFYPYVREANKIVIRDAYIRKDYQIKNLVAFCSIFPERKKDEARVEVLLITGLEDDPDNKVKQIEKLEELKKALLELNIDFRYEFDNTLHDRSIETDTGWRIIPGRGLDIYQDPGTYYSPVNFDQTKRKCKQTDIDFIKIERH